MMAGRMKAITNGLPRYARSGPSATQIRAASTQTFPFKWGKQAEESERGKRVKYDWPALALRRRFRYYFKLSLGWHELLEAV
jgi:hypothetical protein